MGEQHAHMAATTIGTITIFTPVSGIIEKAERTDDGGAIISINTLIQSTHDVRAPVSGKIANIKHNEKKGDLKQAHLTIENPDIGTIQVIIEMDRKNAVHEVVSFVPNVSRVQAKSMLGTIVSGQARTTVILPQNSIRFPWEIDERKYSMNNTILSGVDPIAFYTE